MQTKESIQSQLDALRRQYGEWAYDIPLPFGIWTKGNVQLPHTRLKRIVQIVSDLGRKPLSEMRVLDLGCLDGQFSIEFAKQGAQTVGVEVREANIKKAAFCGEALGLSNLEFRHDDARNVTLETYGRFDAIICSGLLYHLTANDAIELIDAMYEMADRLVIIDTHIARRPEASVEDLGHKYWGSIFREHDEHATPEQKAKKLWSSADNTTAFWFTRPSLVNVLMRTGFSSVYECFAPAHLNYGKPGLEHRDRCTFVAIKDERRALMTSPSANTIDEQFPEHSLDYGAEMPRG